jgi:hypothetical protein
MSSFRDFAIGFISALVFAMFIRFLPVKWARYNVKILNPPEYREDGASWSIPVRISSPKWYTRAFMDATHEYLRAEVKIYGGEWIRTTWDTGDTSKKLLSADGLMITYAIIVTYEQPYSYLGDNTEEKNRIEAVEQICVRVIRSMDNDEADELNILASLKDGKVIFKEQTNATS